MGDVAWLTGLLTATGTLVAWLVRWIVKDVRSRVREDMEHEREISRDWRQVAETEQANSRRTNEILGQVLENQRRMLAILERLPQVVTAPPAGADGWHGYDTSRARHSANPWPP